MKPTARKVRELAMRMLFAFDAQQSADETMARTIASEALNEQAGGRMTQMPDAERQGLIDRAWRLASGAWEERAAIDQRVTAHAPQWPTHRQPGVDRGILRLAVWELTHEPTPPKVVIDEAIELAKEYSTGQSHSFVNAVLDAILKQHVTLTAGGGTADAGNAVTPITDPDESP